MAPVAATWINGCDFEQLGAVCTQPVRLAPMQLERGTDRIEGRVVHVDRFGNAITNIPWEWVNTMPAKLCVWVGERAICRRVTHYAQLPEDRPGFLCGSEGYLELALHQRSLADAWGLERGTRVVMRTGGREPGEPGAQ